MDNRTLFSLMQLNGGTFPSGSFSQSWGLETYVADGGVKNAEQFSAFLTMYIDSVLARCEGPIAFEAIRLSKEWRLPDLIELEELSVAVKLTKESRAASLRSGKAFLRIVSSIFQDEKIAQIAGGFGEDGMSYPVAYGVLCGRIGIDAEEAVAAFLFNAAGALVQSAVKLVPLGNIEGQRALLAAGAALERAVKTGMETGADRITNFAPGLDIASMAHETLPVRLFMT